MQLLRLPVEHVRRAAESGYPVDEIVEVRIIGTRAMTLAMSDDWQQVFRQALRLIAEIDVVIRQERKVAAKIALPTVLGVYAPALGRWIDREVIDRVPDPPAIVRATPVGYLLGQLVNSKRVVLGHRHLLGNLHSVHHLTANIPQRG